MVAVSNSTILIPFGRVTFLAWLPSLFTQLLVPGEVYNETVVRGSGKPGQREISKAIQNGYIHVSQIQDTKARDFLIAREGLDPGEAEVIVLALELGADYALIDEGSAWRVAKAYNDKFATLAVPFVLDMAVESRLIKSSLVALMTLRANGNYHVAREPWKCWCASHGWPL